MARKKDIKPFFATKGDFVESLDNFTQATINLHQAAQMALDLGNLTGPVADRLKEAMAAWDKAALSDQ